MSTLATCWNARYMSVLLFFALVALTAPMAPAQAMTVDVTVTGTIASIQRQDDGGPLFDATDTDFAVDDQFSIVVTIDKNAVLLPNETVFFGENAQYNLGSSSFGFAGPSFAVLPDDDLVEISGSGIPGFITPPAGFTESSTSYELLFDLSAAGIDLTSDALGPALTAIDGVIPTLSLMVGFQDGPPGNTVDYEIGFNASSSSVGVIPLPAAGWLLLSGAGALCLAKRKRRAV